MRVGLSRRRFFGATLAFGGIFGAGLTLRRAEAAPLATLRLDYAYYNPVSLVLRDKGWVEEEFGRNGTKVEWVLSLGSNKALEFLNASVVDFGSSAGSAALMARANGNPIKGVYIYSRPEWTALVTLKDSPIRSVPDLKGKRVAVTRGTDPHIFLLRALDRFGMTTRDIRMVLLQHPDGKTALVRGDVDAWAGLDPYMAQTELEDGSRLFFRDPEGVGFSVEAGEIVAILGTSGAGKSTLLRLVGGIETPSRGEVRLDGKVVTGPSPKLGFVFQEPRLMPWLRVRDNVAFGLGAPKRAERRALAEAALDRVGLADAAGSWPRQLSGGMAQRVAIARALVTRPEVLLLDEPFSALDAFTRLSLQEHLLGIWRVARPTMLFVTHDLDEALMLADRIVVLLGNPGRVRRDERIDLPRPRRRGDPRLSRWRERLFDDLSGVADPPAPELAAAE